VSDRFPESANKASVAHFPTKEPQEICEKYSEKSFRSFSEIEFVQRFGYHPRPFSACIAKPHELFTFAIFTI